MPKDTDKAIWLEEDKLALMNHILQYKSCAPTLAFLVTTSKCREISEKLLAEFGRLYTPKQVSNKIHNLRNITKQYYNIKTKETGLGWNVEYECPEADEDRWASLKEVGVQQIFYLTLLRTSSNDLLFFPFCVEEISGLS